MRNAGMFDAPLTYEQLTAVRRQSETGGQKVSDAQFEQFYQNVQSAWPDFKKLLAKGGLAAVHSHVLQAFESVALRIDREHQVAVSGSVVRFRTVDEYLEAPPDNGPSAGESVCAYLAVAGLYFGVWGYMLWAGAAAFGPVGEAALAIVGLGLGVAGVFCA